MNHPVLYIFSGLPGVGKSFLAKALSERTKSVYIRIDTIEQAIRDLCAFDVQGEGYRLAYRIAEDNLRLGNSVVADSCNPWHLTRREWRQAAVNSETDYINIEVICSDKTEHRRRIESRKSDIPGLVLPDWENVSSRKYETWESPRILVDTAGKTVDESVSCLFSLLSL
ncbi:MAG TPA: AAA family ATPase [Spirochaetota bacterium]|nr:AAA family ATPase [Spirochaetota bacterium]